MTNTSTGWFSGLAAVPVVRVGVVSVPIGGGEVVVISVMEAGVAAVPISLFSLCLLAEY